MKENFISIMFFRKHLFCANWKCENKLGDPASCYCYRDKKISKYTIISDDLIVYHLLYMWQESLFHNRISSYALKNHFVVKRMNIEIELVFKMTSLLTKRVINVSDVFIVF